MNYASNGKANAALTTGIIGTALGAINTLGANGGLLVVLLATPLVRPLSLPLLV